MIDGEIFLDMTDAARPRRLFDGMRFFVTQCAIKTLKRIDDEHPHQPAHSDLILNMLVNVGGMVQHIYLFIPCRCVTLCRSSSTA